MRMEEGKPGPVFIPRAIHLPAQTPETLQCKTLPNTLLPSGHRARGNPLGTPFSFTPSHPFLREPPHPSKSAPAR